jgi:hypothetical protein
MFKKVSSGVLIIVLIVLLGVYVIVRFAGNKERTFKDKILSFEPASVTQILISNPGKEAVDLHQTGGRWMVSSNGKDFAADSMQISGMLKNLSNLPTKRYAGRGKDVWKKYELTDSAATLVTLKSSGKTIADLYVGKFTYTQPKDQQQQQQSRQQQQGDMTTFVRIPKDDDVYAVDGFLKMNFNRDASAYRNRYLSLVTATDITRISDERPEGRYTIEKQDGKWALNGSPADSAKVVRYRSALARLAGSKFIDDPVLPSSSAYTLTIEGNNFSPITLKAYPVTDTNVNYIVTSSSNPGAYFNGKEGGLFKKIWQGFGF